MIPLGFGWQGAMRDLYEWSSSLFQLLRWTRRAVGRPLFRRLMRVSIYGQFMAGETDAPVLSLAEKHARYGVLSMFTYTAIEIHGFTM